MSKLIVDPDGSIRFIYADELRALLTEGTSAIRRVSAVEPAQGGWTADLSPVAGPVLGPFDTRAEALAQEVSWLNLNRL